MRVLLLVLLCGSLALGQPLESRLDGAWTGAAVQAPLDTGYFTGQVKFFRATELRDFQVIRLQLELKTKKKACYTVSLVLLDKQGKLLGAGGYDQIIPSQVNQSQKLEFDITMPLADFARIASYRFLFYEDTAPVGST